jgi:hypothetical protein
MAVAHRYASWHREAVARHHEAYYRYYGPPHAVWFHPWYPGYPHYWYHGVFVYGPPPWYYHHDVVIVERDGGPPPKPEEAPAPVRKVDRSHTFAVGIRGGSYMGSYGTGDVFGDAGLGLALRYRPVEALGFELSWEHHDATWDAGTSRQDEPIQASVELFATPWARVSPYILAGVTVTGRHIADEVGPYAVDTDKALWGPDGGIGLEVGVGKKVSVNGDVRFIGYVNKPADDLTNPGAFTADLGVNFYF